MSSELVKSNDLFEYDGENYAAIEILEATVTIEQMTDWDAVFGPKISIKTTIESQNYSGIWQLPHIVNTDIDCLLLIRQK